MFTRPPPWPVAPARMLSLFEIEHDAQDSPYRAKIRALSGQRSTTLEMVISGVICANGVSSRRTGVDGHVPLAYGLYRCESCSPHLPPARVSGAGSSSRSGSPG